MIHNDVAFNGYGADCFWCTKFARIGLAVYDLLNLDSVVINLATADLFVSKSALICGAAKLPVGLKGQFLDLFVTAVFFCTPVDKRSFLVCTAIGCGRVNTDGYVILRWESSKV